MLLMSYRGHSWGKITNTALPSVLSLENIHIYVHRSYFNTKEIVEHGRLHTIVCVFWFCCTSRNGHKAVASEWDISVSFLDPDKGKSVSAYAIFLICI